MVFIREREKAVTEFDASKVCHFLCRCIFDQCMIGGNAIRVYGLDADKLQAVASRINSLTFEQLAIPFDDEPEDFLTRSAAFAFRREGPFV